LSGGECRRNPRLPLQGSGGWPPELPWGGAGPREGAPGGSRGEKGKGKRSDGEGRDASSPLLPRGSKGEKEEGKESDGEGIEGEGRGQSRPPS